MSLAIDDLLLESVNEVMDSYNEIETVYKRLGDEIFLLQVPVELVANRKKITGLGKKAKLLKELSKRVRSKYRTDSKQTKNVIDVFKNAYNKIQEIDDETGAYLVQNYWLAYLIDFYNNNQIDMINTLTTNKLTLLAKFKVEAMEYLRNGKIDPKLNVILDDIRFQVELKYSGFNKQSVLSKKKIKLIRLKIFDIQMIIAYLWDKMDGKLVDSKSEIRLLSDYFVDSVYEVTLNY